MSIWHCFRRLGCPLRQPSLLINPFNCLHNQLALLPQYPGEGTLRFCTDQKCLLHLWAPQDLRRALQISRHALSTTSTPLLPPCSSPHMLLTRPGAYKLGPISGPVWITPSMTAAIAMPRQMLSSAWMPIHGWPKWIQGVGPAKTLPPCAQCLMPMDCASSHHPVFQHTVLAPSLMLSVSLPALPLAR